MNKYKCIIFDCDGVLIDSESIAIDTLVEMANKLGANMDFKESMISFKGKSLNSCLDLISRRLQNSLPVNFEKDYRTKSFENFKQQVKPIKGIKKVLDNLKIPFCVASSGPENKIRLNLELTGLLPYFENRIFSCYSIQKWKPEPDVFLWAAKTMGYESKDCLVIEDSISGVRGAKAGGFTVFGYSEHDYHDELKNEADLIFNDMVKLLDLL